MPPHSADRVGSLIWGETIGTLPRKSHLRGHVGAVPGSSRHASGQCVPGLDANPPASTLHSDDEDENDYGH